MASSNPVRRTAAVTGFAFALLTVAVGVGAYSQRDKAVTVAVRDSQSETADTVPANSTDSTPDAGSLTGTTTSIASDSTVAPPSVDPASVDPASTDPALTADASLAEPSTTEPVPSSTASSSTTSTTRTTSSTSSTSSTTTSTSTTSTSTTSTTIARSASSCPELDGSSPRRASFAAAPPICIDARATYTAVIETSEGTIKIALDADNAPKTVNNFVFLSRFHFYDGLTIHRVVPGFIIQGGDPLANSNGGPGYTFADELPGKDGYEVGAVAMANSGVNTNGSQFFIVTGPTGEALKGTYSTFGKVTKGTSVLKAIDALGRAPGANAVEYPPQRKITIQSVTITAVGERKARIPGFGGSSSATTTVG